MAVSSICKNNALLAAVPDAVRQRWTPELKWVFMPLDQVLCEQGQRLSHVYFPVTALVSLMYVTKSGASSGLASIGCEGLVGVEAFMDGQSMPGRAVVQSDGYGFRLPAALVKKEFHRSQPTMDLLLRYTEALMVQISQLAVCSRHHPVESRLAGWLLWQFDHIKACEIPLTHERIASQLGVRRESVSEALNNLQKLGVVKYGRGHVSVESRIGLEKRSCECAHVIKLAYDQLQRGDVGVTDAKCAGITPHKPWREPVEHEPRHLADVIRCRRGVAAAVRLPPAAQLFSAS